MSIKSDKPWLGLALKDRSADDIREALTGQDPEAVTQALALHAYAVQHNLGLSTLHHRTGIPTGLLSSFFNGAYTGDYTAIAERIAKFFWRLEQKDKYGGIRKFVETRLALYMWGVFEKTRVIRRIQIVEGPEQVGKTRAAVEYCHRNNSGRTVYVQIPGGSKSGCGDFIWTLAQTLQIPYTVKLREKRIRIKEALDSCDLLIIDEAHLMWSWTQSSIREFLDFLRTDVFNNGERGVVLMATNSDTVKGINKFRRESGYNVGQMLGRMRNEVIRIDPADDITPEDVRTLVSRFYQPADETVTKLHEIACRESLGHFGLLDDIMNESWTRARAKGKKEPNDQIVLQTAQIIMNNLRDRKELYQ